MIYITEIYSPLKLQADSLCYFDDIFCGIVRKREKYMKNQFELKKKTSQNQEKNIQTNQSHIKNRPCHEKKKSNADLFYNSF